MCLCAYPCVSLCGCVRTCLFPEGLIEVWRRLTTSGEDPKGLCLIPLLSPKSIFLYPRHLSRWRSHCVIHALQYGSLSLFVTDSSIKSSSGTSQQIKGCPLLCFHRTLFGVCELLLPFIPAAAYGFVCVICFTLHRPENVAACECVWRVVRACVWMVSHLLPSLCACTHVDTLSLILYTCPRGKHPIPPASVRSSSRHLIPLTPCMYCMQRGTLFPSFTMETRHVLIPSSFPVSRPRAVCLLILWGTWLSQNRCPVLYTSGLYNILFILTVSLEWMLLETWQGKKQCSWRLLRDVCWLLLSMTSLMYASWILGENTPLDSWYFRFISCYFHFFPINSNNIVPLRHIQTHSY